MKIVTGHTGENHVTANDAQAFNQGIVGTDNYVLNVGNKFAATLSDATHVVVQDGDGVMQGVHFRIELGTVETLTISSGTTGKNRIDLICARYIKTSGVESVSLVVVEGTESSSTPSEPTYNTGDILGGDSPVDYPIWKVTLTGLTPALTSMATVLPSVNGLNSTASTHATQIGARQTKEWTHVNKSSLVTVNSSTSTLFPTDITFTEPTEVSMFAYIYSTGDVAHPSSANAVIWIGGDSEDYFFVDMKTAGEGDSSLLLHSHFIANTGDKLKIPILGTASGNVAVDVDMWTRPTGLAQ